MIRWNYIYRPKSIRNAVYALHFTILWWKNNRESTMMRYCMFSCLHDVVSISYSVWTFFRWCCQLLFGPAHLCRTIVLTSLPGGRSYCASAFWGRGKVGWGGKGEGRRGNRRGEMQKSEGTRGKEWGREEQVREGGRGRKMRGRERREGREGKEVRDGEEREWGRKGGTRRQVYQALIAIKESCRMNVLKVLNKSPAASHTHSLQ